MSIIDLIDARVSVKEVPSVYAQSHQNFSTTATQSTYTFNSRAGEPHPGRYITVFVFASGGSGLISDVTIDGYGATKVAEPQDSTVSFSCWELFYPDGGDEVEVVASFTDTKTRCVVSVFSSFNRQEHSPREIKFNSMATAEDSVVTVSPPSGSVVLAFSIGGNGTNLQTASGLVSIPNAQTAREVISVYDDVMTFVGVNKRRGYIIEASSSTLNRVLAVVLR